MGLQLAKALPKYELKHQCVPTSALPLQENSLEGHKTHLHNLNAPSQQPASALEPFI